MCLLRHPTIFISRHQFLILLEIFCPPTNLAQTLFFLLLSIVQAHIMLGSSVVQIMTAVSILSPDRLQMAPLTVRLKGITHAVPQMLFLPVFPQQDNSGGRQIKIITRSLLTMLLQFLSTSMRQPIHPQIIISKFPYKMLQEPS